MKNIAHHTIHLDEKCVLITGGTGSFGQRFAQTILKEHNPRKVIILSRDEHKQYSMQKSQAFSDAKELRYFIGDVRDVDRLRMAMRGVDYVFHAAALKHVPTAEYNPLECIHTNVHGAENVVKAALDCGVQKVIALSTDKAVNPINIYGASKLAADKIFVAANLLAGENATRFSVIRYGNVLGSRGSIVPLVRKLVEEKCPSLPLTDEHMTRFWITLQQGINFVLSSAAIMQGGEIFVPKIPSMKVADLIEALAPAVPKHIIGVRPGEKLHEVLISEEDTATVLEYMERYIICPPQDPRVQIYHEKEGGQKLSKNFRYASDNNDHWLQKEALLNLI